MATHEARTDEYVFTPEQCEALEADMKRGLHANMAKQEGAKPLPPDKCPVGVFDVESPDNNTLRVFFLVMDGPKHGRCFCDTFDLRDNRDAQRFAELLEAAGLSEDARPAELDCKDVLAVVRCVAGRTRNVVAGYKRDPNLRD